MTKELMPSILDREIDSEHRDAFGHRHYTLALESLIEAPGNQPPFSVGLLGKWGSGKSSIKSMYLKALADSRSNGQVFPVTFNAWRYGGEDLKRALLRHVYLAAGGDKTALDDALFNALQETVKRPLSWKEIGSEFCERFLWPSAQLLLAAVCLALIGYFVAAPFPLTNPWTSASVMAGLTVLGWKLFEQLPKLNKIFLSRSASIVRVDAPRSNSEQFEDLLVNQIKHFKRGRVLNGIGKKCKRLVVFIDDLDRLSSEEMVAGLDAIRTFMEIPLDTTGVGIIFVISCDEDRIAEALYRSKATTTDMPGAVFSRSDARRYLDRIFQFRLEIPELPKRDMRAFATERLRADVPQFVSDLEKAGVPLENVIDRMIHVGVASPRNALQILNSFAQCWWIAKKRETVGPGTERAGGLQQGAVTKHPVTLAVLSALRVDFPDFFHYLVKEPDLVERFTAVFIRNELLEEQPESSRNILAEYADRDGELLPRHRPLKRFLNGLAGLRWPESLQPLLILSQDPITRKHGDKAIPLYEAFVSADSDEVLRILGRDADNRPLSGTEVRLLKDMVEDLERETPVRRDNAAACLAQLADRLPDGQAHHLLSPLARRLSHSPSLRHRLGVPKIKNVLPQATPEERRDVADKLVSDLLMVEGETDFRLPTGQKPLLDDAIQMARDACDLMLFVRNLDGLPSSTDEQFLRWMEVRRVEVNGKEDSLPFAEFEEWVSHHEATLLPSLKDRYTHLVGEQFEADTTGELFIEDVLRKCKKVFDVLWEEGQDSQAILWGQLTRFAAVRSKDAVALAWTEIMSHPEGPKDEELSRFVVALSERLKKDAEDEDKWGVEWEAGGNALVFLLNNSRTSLDVDAEQALAGLVTAWAEHDVCGGLACNVLNILVSNESDQSAGVIQDWVGRLLVDLSPDCTRWCGEHFESEWTEQQRNQTVKRLNQHIGRDDVPENEAQRYAVVMRAFPPTALNTNPLQSHLSNLCAQIQARSGNPNDYLKRLFPTAATLLDHCEPSPAGEMLRQVFTMAKSNPPLFCWLHSQMMGRWLKASESTGAYSPSQIFDEAVQISLSSPSVDGMGDVLRSLTSMSERDIELSDVPDKLVQVACAVWPYHGDIAAEVLKSAPVLPTADAIARLLDGVSLEPEEDAQQLNDIWSHFAQRYDEANCVSITKMLLAQQPENTEQRADCGLSMWIDCCGERSSDILGTVIFQGDLTDDQRRRVWLQIDERSKQIDRSFVLEVLPDLLKLPESPETTRAVIDSQEQLNKLFPSKANKYNFGKVLLTSFASSPSRENQNRILQWVKSLGVDAVLKELANLGELTEEDIDMLKAVFPGSRHLKKVQVEAIE